MCTFYFPLSDVAVAAVPPPHENLNIGLSSEMKKIGKRSELGYFTHSYRFDVFLLYPSMESTKWNVQKKITWIWIS